MNIKPLGDRVLIKRIEADDKTKSGILLTTHSKESTQLATVLEVGTGTGVVIGDIIIISKYAGTRIKCDGEEYELICQSDILAVVSSEK